MKKLDKEEVRIVKGNFKRKFKKQINDEKMLKSEIELFEMFNGKKVTKEDFVEAFEEIIETKENDFYEENFYRLSTPLNFVSEYLENK